MLQNPWQTHKIPTGEVNHIQPVAYSYFELYIVYSVLKPYLYMYNVRLTSTGPGGFIIWTRAPEPRIEPATPVFYSAYPLHHGGFLSLL